MKQQLRWHDCATEAELVDTATRAIAGCAAKAITAAGGFRIVLAGGETPRKIYAALIDITTDWNAWHIYFGDERCLPEGDPGRNDTMAMDAWLDHVSIPKTQIHSIDAHMDVGAAARQYAGILAGVNQFDLVLLGLGEDGHTASLFPNHLRDLEKNADPVIAVHDAPKPPRNRITLSPRRLSQADQVFFLIAGENKRQAVRSWRAEEDIPASYVTPAEGVDVFLTANAAGDKALRQ